MVRLAALFFAFLAWQGPAQANTPVTAAAIDGTTAAA